jgi:hypothetical protein
MKKATGTIKTIICAVILSLAMPVLGLADPPSGKARARQLRKKADKFINGHDARDGRWDRRGRDRDRDSDRRFDSNWFDRDWRDRDDDDDDDDDRRRRRLRRIRAFRGDFGDFFDFRRFRRDRD